MKMRPTSKRKLSLLLPFAIAVIIVVLAGVAMSASNSPDELAQPSDAAISGSDRVLRSEADTKTTDEWGVRVYRNKRGEKCADVGILLDGQPSVRAKGQRVKLAPGQEGTCGPDTDGILLASKAMPTSEAARTVFFGTVNADVTAVRVSYLGSSRRVVPSGDEHAVLAVFDGTILSGVNTDAEKRAMMEEASRNPAASVPHAVLEFKDGSELPLYDPNAERPEKGSQADKASKQLG